MNKKYIKYFYLFPSHLFEYNIQRRIYKWIWLKDKKKKLF